MPEEDNKIPVCRRNRQKWGFAEKNMVIEKCTDQNIEKLAELNKQLIEDEMSDNTMSAEELKNRMRTFLDTDYEAYFFKINSEVIGYALVNISVQPVYLRQFLICREYRRKHYGEEAFQLLMEKLNVNTIDVEVLSWNEAGSRFWEKLGFVERSRYMRYSD